MKILIFCFSLLSLWYAGLSHASDCEKAVGSGMATKEKDTYEKSFVTRSPIKKPLNHRLEQKQQTSLEKQLKKLGLREIFTDGVDSAQQLTELAKTLRTRNIDPKTTHIPEFADMAMRHIEFIKKGIQNEYKKTKQKKLLTLLEEIKKQAQERIKTKAVTYQWWLSFNYLLTCIISVPAHRYNVASSFEKNIAIISDQIKHNRDNYGLRGVSEKIKQIITRFPKIISLPTPFSLGFIAINSMFASYIQPLEISNKTNYADGIHLSPKRLFYHDIEHDIGSTRHYKILSNIYIKFTQIRNTLSNTEIEMVETIFFYMLHEYNNYMYWESLSSDLKDKNSFSSVKQRLKHSIKYIIQHQTEFFYDTDEYLSIFGVSLPKHIKTKSEINDYLRESLKVFFRVTKL